MDVIKETLWKRCLSTPTKLPAKNSNICLSETAYQHKRTRKKCKKINQAAIIQWQRQYLMYKPHRNIASPDRSQTQATFLSRVPVHCITPFCSDALVSPPNLYPPWPNLYPPWYLYKRASYISLYLITWYRKDISFPYKSFRNNYRSGTKFRYHVLLKTTFVRD